MNDIDLLAARIKATRIKKKLTQEEVGNRIGAVSYTHLTKTPLPQE